MQSTISLFKALVLSIICYGSVRWSPYTNDSFKKLEAVQQRLMRYCSVKLSTPMHFFDHIYPIVMYNLQTIESLFYYNDLTTVFNIMRGYLDLISYLSPTSGTSSTPSEILVRSWRRYTRQAMLFGTLYLRLYTTQLVSVVLSAC